MRLLKPLTATLWAVVLLLSVCGCRQQSGHTLQAQNQPQVYYPTVNEGVILPPFLSKGDTIGLVAPAYKDDLNEIKYAIQWLEKQGFHILNGQCIDLHHSTIYSGTDEERAAVTALQGTEGMQVNELAMRLQLPVQQLSGLLFELEMKGYVAPAAGGVYRLRR